MGRLSDKFRTAFLDLVEENKEHDLFIDAFKEFEDFKAAYKEYLDSKKK